MRFKKGPEVPGPAGVTGTERATCRYCGCAVDRLTLTDGRVLNADPDRSGGRGGMFARSHWRTCPVIQQSGRAIGDDDQGDGQDLQEESA